MGPTAAGKTDLAVELVQRYPLDIISVDSALVYRGLEIGAAKPGAEVLRIAPHRLIDLCAPTEAYSAADFCRDAAAAMEQSRAAGRVPLLVGGTGMYFRSLQRGLSALPEADAVVRRRLEGEAAELGWGALHERLQRLDPAAAARIHRNDPQRIQRALEVIEISGRGLSEQQGHRRGSLTFRVLKLALCPTERSVLHERIVRRFDAMIEAGLLAEVAALMRRPGIHADLPAMRAVGYRQAWQHLNGDLTAGEWVERGVFATRQLAKRQITWMRSEHDAFWRDPGAGHERADVARLIAGFCGWSDEPDSAVSPRRTLSEVMITGEPGLNGS